ncbi:MAG: efflux transporter outer membrane subunit [Silvibacterium sp.]|nr:efflux transporter outer membrane subunit [Silvibacterium sp.]MBV8438017.1 efflux transporter outer membrane subunit [Silvibacterium sp.]
MKKTSANPIRPALAALALCSALCGCLPGPKYQKPSAPAATAPAYKESPANFKDAEGWKVAQPQEGMLRGKWWEIFNDPELNALEEQLDINNQNIKVNFENYMAARAVIREDRAQLWPTVTTGPSWNRARSSSNLTNSSTANVGHESTEWTLPLDVSWSPDFFGKIRSQIREAQYGAQVSAADLEVERLLEEATLAETYFEIRGQDELQRVLNDTVEADKKALELTQNQYETGIGSYISVVEARATLKQVESQALNVGVARAQYEHAIATLLGQPATGFSIPVKPLLISPPPVPIGVPSQLLERRPDVAATERTLAEANATIGIGYGAFFPTVTLSAAGGFEASQFTKWFDWPSRFWSIGPQLSQTLFNGGLYRAALQQYTAQYNANVATYRQTVLTAFQQVEDYLAATRILSQQILKQKEAVDSSKEELDLEMFRYQSGIDPYLSVTVAQTTLLSNQQSLTTLSVQQTVAAVELIQALGGGWDVSQLPTTAQVSEKPNKADYTRQK